MRPLRQVAGQTRRLAEGTRQLAERTPESRDRFVDLLRVLALVLVVLGHWLISVIDYGPHHQLTGHSALESISWAFPLTWVFQVLPVFFMVGGYANSASLTSHGRRGEDAVGWLQDRAARLVRPTTTLLLVLAAGALVAWLSGADRTEIRLAVWTASVPLWFLIAYLLVVALTPVMYALHRRFGVAVPLVMLGLVALGDILRFARSTSWASGNYLFGWLVIHQVGFLWRDGRLPTGRKALPLLVGGLIALVGLTVFGPYSESMIDIGGMVKNTSPPTLALLATAGAQLGLILTLYEPAQRWLHRRRPWEVVVATNSVLLTIFLWHMSALLVVAGTLSWAGALPTPRVDTTLWWLWRIPWLIMLSIVLVVLVAIFGRIELRHPHRPETRPDWMAVPLCQLLAWRVPRLMLTAGGYAAVIVGLAINSATSRFRHEPVGIPVVALALYLAGALVLRLLFANPAKRA
jgi:hypothetical protein